MSDRQDQNEIEEPEEKTSDMGEGERGVTSPSRGGTFRSTPGESGDRGETESGGPGVKIPHLQDE